MIRWDNNNKLVITEQTWVVLFKLQNYFAGFVGFAGK